MKRTQKLIFTLLGAALFGAMALTPTFAAPAANTQSAGGGAGGLIMMIVLLGVVFYFFMYRPQKKQEKEIREMRESLSLGDEVVTNAGILGRIIRIKDDIITLELGSNRNTMKVYNWAIREVVLPANADVDEEPKKVEAEK